MVHKMRNNVDLVFFTHTLMLIKSQFGKILLHAYFTKKKTLFMCSNQFVVSRGVAKSKHNVKAYKRKTFISW